MQVTCPKPTSLTAISAVECPVDFGQIVKIYLQRQQDTTTTYPFNTTNGEITAKASWDTFIAAVDDTKIVETPTLSNPVLNSSEGAFEGGDDNTTPYGLRIYKGENTTTFEAAFRSLNADVIAELRALSQETLPQLAGTLTAYFVLADGRILARKGSTATDHEGIPIYSWRVGSVGSEGYKADNMNPLSFDLREGWDEDFDVVTGLDFDPAARLGA